MIIVAFKQATTNFTSNEDIRVESPRVIIKELQSKLKEYCSNLKGIENNVNGHTCKVVEVPQSIDIEKELIYNVNTWIGVGKNLLREIDVIDLEKTDRYEIPFYIDNVDPGLSETADYIILKVAAEFISINNNRLNRDVSKEEKSKNNQSSLCMLLFLNLLSHKNETDSSDIVTRYSRAFIVICLKIFRESEDIRAKFDSFFRDLFEDFFKSTCKNADNEEIEKLVNEEKERTDSNKVKKIIKKVSKRLLRSQRTYLY